MIVFWEVMGGSAVITCDYPVAANVRFGVKYANNTKVGTFVGCAGPVIGSVILNEIVGQVVSGCDSLLGLVVNGCEGALIGLVDENCAGNVIGEVINSDEVIGLVSC